MKFRTLMGAAAVFVTALAPFPAGPARAATATIQVVDGATTEPATLTVTAGDTVVFLNVGVIPHNPTAEDGSFKLPALKPGESASVTFNQAGTVPFLCTLHTAQRGTIIVLPAPAEPAQPAPTAEPAPAAEPVAGPLDVVPQPGGDQIEPPPADPSG